MFVDILASFPATGDLTYFAAQLFYDNLRLYLSEYQC